MSLPAFPGELHRHPRPWRVVWTQYGESMGTGSYSSIVDAHGNHVARFGMGAHSTIAQDEALARLLVALVNQLP